MPVSIRSATKNDLPAIIAIEGQSASSAHWTREQYARRIETGQVLVAESEGDTVGFICSGMVVPEWEIENMVVAERSRGRGVADALLGELLRMVKSRAGVTVWLEVRESNGPARRLYEKHGFRQTGRRRGYYQQPMEDAVLYAWKVGDQ